MADSKILYRDIPLVGKLITTRDPAEIVEFSPNGNVVNYSTMQNMRYNGRHPRAIGGMTKVNTTVLGNPKIKSAFHFRKDSPQESNVLVSARDSNGVNQKVYRNNTAIPSAGDFTATPIFTDSSGYGSPMWSTTPGEKVLYCNGKDTALWGGDEAVPIGFIDMDPNGTYKYDYTEQVKNGLTDSNNIATLHSRTDTYDANTLLLLHLNNNVTDTTGTHTVTNTNATFSTVEKKFGTHSVYFDGSGDYLTVPDHADFDFSGGTWTVDFWAYPSTYTAGSVFYYQGAGAADYMKISMIKPTIYTWGVKLDIYTTGGGGTPVVTLSSGAIPIVPGGFHHIAVVENADNYYIFIDGAVSATTSDTDRPANYTETVYIGSDATPGNYFNGYIDELRVSNVARWTSAFDPPTLEYGNYTITSVYVGSQLPIQGVNPYVLTANTSAGAVTGNYWGSSGWTSTGTVSGVGATPLSSAGKNTWTFSSTATVAKQKSIDDKVCYWYRFDITSCDTTTTIYRITVDTPMQQFKELWDGFYRTCSSFLVYKSSALNDYTVNVFEDSWSSSDTSSFVELDSLASTNYAIAGFTERQMGLRLHFIGGHVNTTAGTSVQISTFNGTGSHLTTASWTPVSAQDDGTSNAGISISKSGTVTWSPAALSTEFKVSISGAKSKISGGSSSPSMYYYKIQFDKNLSSDVQLFFVGGIPAPEDVSGYKFGVHHVDRLWLWGDEKDPLRGVCTGLGTSQVIRGSDTAELYLKNTPVAGVSLFERYGSTAANIQLVCEQTRTWAIVGETVDNFQPTCIDGSNGCVAPLTMDVATVEISPGTFRRVGMWQAQGGIVMSDGSSVAFKSMDIEDKFDPLHSNYVGASILPTCSGWIDVNNNEYHWVIPDSTQWVYNITENRWSEMPLATGKRLAGGVSVYDTSGVSYPYGFTSSGYLYRMEYGTTFDGTAMTFVLQLADMAPTGMVSDRTEACSLRLIGKAKETTTNKITLAHYGDSSTSASTPSIPTVSMSNSGKRLFSVIRTHPASGKAHVFHSYKTTVSTSDETIGYEPIIAVMGYRFHSKDFR